MVPSLDIRDHARWRAALPKKDSGAWSLIVRFYARFGKLCDTAKLVYRGEYPPELVAEAKEQRAIHLRGETPCSCLGCRFLEDAEVVAS